MSATHTVWNQASLRRHVVRTRQDGSSEVVLVVDGLRCANCVLSLERALLALPALKRVRINAASHRAHIVWDTDKHQLSDILQCMGQAGFQARPLDARALSDRRGEESKDALKRLLVAGFGAMQAMMFATVLYLGAIDPMDETTRDLFRWLGFLVATPVVMYSARPFYQGALRSLSAGKLGMDVPIALAIALVYGASLYVALNGGHEVYFDSVSMFVFFLLTGRYLEMRGRHKAMDLTDALASLLPDTAVQRQPDGGLKTVPALELKPGDRIVIDSGEVIAADGKLLNSQCLVDEAMLSGESQSIRKSQDDLLLAGSMLQQGPAEITIERCGADTTMASIISLVERAQAERPRLAKVGEKIVSQFVLLVLTLAAATGVFWALVDDSRIFTAVIAVLVVSCPCAFALAVPAAMTRVLAVLAREGVLVSKPDAIETIATANHIVFDKTGTLTNGLKLHSVDVLGTDKGPKETNRFVDIAAALGRENQHPVSQVIAAATKQGQNLTLASDVETFVGLGVQGQIHGDLYRLGRARFALSENLHEWPKIQADDLILADVTGPLARFELSECIRDNAESALQDLRNAGFKISLASGDSSSKVDAVADQLHIEHRYAGQLPSEKLDYLKQLRSQGACVAAVGDGINDGPILAGADVSFAMGQGTDLARASSDFVLVGGDLQKIILTRHLAKESLKVIQRNQRWALVYNLIAIPLAAAGYVPPWLAALGMSASSIMVVLNALQIGRNLSPQRMENHAVELTTT
ncbi:MAG: heavy metal translocating P-type ATPase [Oceanococcus sp.]